jgi:hypothetical protein
MFIAVVVLAALAIGWLTRGLVGAYVEIKHAQIFPTTIVADGWDEADHSLTLDLPPNAPYPSFTRDNSAYIEIGSSTPPVATSSIPMLQGGITAPDASTTPPAPTEIPIPPAAATSSLDAAPVPDPVATTSPTSLRTRLDAIVHAVLARTAAIAIASTTGTSTAASALAACA